MGYRRPPSTFGIKLERLAVAAPRLLGRGRGQQVLGAAGRVFEDGGEKLLADQVEQVIAEQVRLVLRVEIIHAVDCGATIKVRVRQANWRRRRWGPPSVIVADPASKVCLSTQRRSTHCQADTLPIAK